MLLLGTADGEPAVDQPDDEGEEQPAQDDAADAELLEPVVAPDPPEEVEEP